MLHRRRYRTMHHGFIYVYMPLVTEIVACKAGLGRLAAWHLPRGPVCPAVWWAATSDVVLGQTTNPTNRGRAGKERREGSEDSHKEEEREGRSGTGEGPRV